MLSVGLLRRVVALQLLVVIPAVFGARISLDAPWKLNADDHIEAEHCDDCCARAHDHTLCALLLHSPWSSDAPDARPALTVPPARSLSTGESHRLYAGPLNLEVARSPPHQPDRESR